MRITTRSGSWKLVDVATAPGGAAGFGDCYLFAVGGTKDVVCDISSSPEKTSHGFLNEKGCSHLNYKGTISLFPLSKITDYSAMAAPFGLTTVTSGPAKVPRKRFKVSGLSRYYETILDIGQNYQRSCPAVSGTKGSYSWEFSPSSIICNWKGAFTFETRQLVSSRSKLTTGTNWSVWTTSMVAYEFIFTDDYSKVSVAQWSRTVNGRYDRYTDEPVFVHSASVACTVLTTVLSGPTPVVNLPSKEYLRLLRSEMPPNYWGDLAGVAADDAKALNINTSVFLYQLKDLVGALKTLKTAIKRPRPKTVAKAYLAWKYGIAQSYRDTLTAIAAIKETFPEHLTFSIVRSAGNLVASYSSTILTVVSDSCHYKIFYDASPYKQVEKFLRDWDFWPTATNIWDVIPFSFVVDWFTNLSQFLEYHDRQKYYDTLDVLGVTKSRRTVYQFTPEVKNYMTTGSASIVIYDRMTQPACDPTFLLFKSPDTFHNWAEGTALIISKRKKT